MTGYTSYSDEEILEIYSTTMDYSGKIGDDLNNEISNRGGLDKLLKNIEEKNRFQNELKRINKEVHDLYSKKKDSALIKKIITSEIFTEEKVNEIIDQRLELIRANIHDRSINSRTIIGSIIGIFIATFLVGYIWYMTILYTGKMMSILIPGFAFVSYMVISTLTKQSRNNTLVFLATFTSTFLGIILGILLFRFL